jgi:hypothetical protein
VRGQDAADSSPVWINEYAAGVEKDRFEHVSRAVRSGPTCLSA